MSERYSRLFSLRENVYSFGAPVIIAAGALLKDNQTGKVLVQLKMRNIQGKTIKAVKVKIAPFDTAEKPIGRAVDYQYLDLAAGRDTDFGQKTPIILPDATTRSFSVSVSEVIYSDNSTWTDHGEVWEPLSAPVTTEKAFSDDELEKQYRIKYGADCKCIFKKEKDLWWCACGALNHDSETNCHKCLRNAATLTTLNLGELKAERDERLAAERERAAQEKATAEIKGKKKRKFMLFATLLLVAISIPVICLVLYQKNEPYRTVDSAIDSGEFSTEWVEQNELTELLQYKAISDNLSRYQEQNDFVSAMELVTVLYESGISLDHVDKMSEAKISSGFVTWVAETVINEAKQCECVPTPRTTYLSGGAWAISQDFYYDAFYFYDSLGYDFRCEDADGNGNLDNIELLISNTEKFDENMSKSVYKHGKYRVLGRLNQAISVEQLNIETTNNSNAPYVPEQKDITPDWDYLETQLSDSCRRTLSGELSNSEYTEAERESILSSVEIVTEDYEQENDTILGVGYFSYDLPTEKIRRNFAFEYQNREDEPYFIFCDFRNDEVDLELAKELL